MIEEIACKTVTLGLATASVYLPLAQLPTDDAHLGIVREYGSFGLLIVFVLGFLWILKGLAPIISGMLQKSVDGFLGELAQQRTAREAADIRHIQSIEKFRDDFREMLSSHKTAIVDSINKQSDAMEKLAEGLESRPCQLPIRKQQP